MTPAALKLLWPGTLFPGCNPYEIRLFDAGGVRHTALVDDPEEIAAVAEDAARDDWTVYATLNPVRSDLVPREQWNTFRPVRFGGTARDRDIARRLQFFLDIEPDRPSGVGTTADQLAAARTLAELIADELRPLGLEPLAVVCSGNGYHVRYRVDLPADDGGLVKRVLAAVAHWYSGVVPGVKVDASVSNAARLARIPGTVNLKGDGSPERPHRLCEVVDLNSDAAAVTAAQLNAVADEGPAPAVAVTAPKPSIGPAGGGLFDLENFISAHLPDAAGPEPYDGGRKWVLPVCPWDASHDNAAAFVIERPGGVIQAGCLHDSCRDWHWPDLRALFDRRYAVRLATKKRLQRMPAAIAKEWRRHGHRK